MPENQQGYDGRRGSISHFEISGVLIRFYVCLSCSDERIGDLLECYWQYCKQVFELLKIMRRLSVR